MKHQIFFYVCLFYLPMALGHGLVHEQIDELTHLIKNNPQNVELYLKRGRLFIEAKHYHEANTDFEQALKLDNKTRAAYYFLGDVALKTAQFDQARQYANIFIKKLTSEAAALTRGYRLLGAAYQGRGNYLLAAKAYQTAINYSKTPRPEFYLDLADVYAQLKDYVNGLITLNDGMKKLSSLAVFQDRALKFEIASNAYKKALNRIDRMIKNGARLPFLYDKKGQIFEWLQHYIEAKQSYQNALNEIDKLPLSRRNSRVLRDLRISILAKLNNID